MAPGSSRTPFAAGGRRGARAATALPPASQAAIEVRREIRERAIRAGDTKDSRRRHKRSNKQSNKQSNKESNKHSKKQSNKQSNKQINKQSNKQSNKQCNKHSNKQTNKHGNKHNNNCSDVCVCAEGAGRLPFFKTVTAAMCIIAARLPRSPTTFRDTSPSAAFAGRAWRNLLGGQGTLVPLLRRSARLPSTPSATSRHLIAGAREPGAGQRRRELGYVRLRRGRGRDVRPCIQVERRRRGRGLGALRRSLVCASRAWRRRRKR